MSPPSLGDILSAKGGSGPGGKRKIVIIGVGNILKADDGFGPALVESLKGKVKAVCIDAGTTPENFTGTIIKEKPDTILIVDAADLGQSPGCYQILEKEDILSCGFTTHDISANMFIEYLNTQTKASIYMLGVQPKRVTFSQGLSPELTKTLGELDKLIGEKIHA